MRTIRLLAIIAAYSLVSCGKDKKNATGTDINIDSVINGKSTDPDALGANECLLDYQTKYDGLLSEGDVIAATGFSNAELKTQYNKVLKNAETHEFVYKFENGRIGKVRGLNREMELTDVVSVRSVKAMSLRTFQQTYQAITDRQIEAANQALDDIANGNSGDANADQALAKAKEQNVSNEQVKNTGGILTGAFQEVSKGYRNVAGLGDAAIWNIVTNELFVLQDGVKFELMVEVSNDVEKNKSVAVSLAKIVLAKCS